MKYLDLTLLGPISLPWLIIGSFHYWESELTFSNLINFGQLANQKFS